MSSAAVQASGPAISNRQYQQQSSHGRDQYYNQPSPNVATSPAPSKKPSRRPSGNGASPNTPTTPQNHYSPAGSTTSNLTTPRGQPLPPSTHASPVMSATVTSAYNSAGGPPVPPPRTSSHHRNHTSTTAASGTQLATRSPDDRPSSSRAVQQHAAGYGSGSDRENIRDDSATAAANAAQPRRKAHPSPKDGPRHQGSGSNRAKHSPAQPTHSRSANAVGQPPVGTSLPREESTVINRLVVADPQEDIAREEARQAEARPVPVGADITPITGLGLVGSEGVDDGGRGAGKSRQDHSKSEGSRKHTKFGEYVLGQTLGEGEFGKVKMGWKKDGGVEVAIKLIRRETLGSNQNRIAKIYREIHILRGLDHPNIVRLHEMVETERHIGIILEYASGGELFDYILNHRYLKDNAARRLFAQLISGVGYLHKKGIVHRDLKLENLLLDRNRNIIITDFGFANTFDPNDELGDEIEYNLTNREFVKKMNLEQVNDEGRRRGDLMQTSCGSPCYAAPELVVSDSLYTGRKVDVWSCGVILYAMLAGYLPFDDDPANPEGDNINLLYKYIVSTPLTFPEYVTPHARDLLKRILVPDPRKRADLFEVARHSWLSDYAHVVGFITSSTTTSSDIANTTVTSQDPFETPMLARSASVREPGKPHTAVSPVGGLTPKHGNVNRAEQADKTKGQRDTKRRTVQVEYVAPQSQTMRGEASPPAASSSATASGTPRTRVKTEQGPIEVPPADGYQPSTTSIRTQTRPSPASSSMPPPTRLARDAPRTVSDSTAFGNAPVTSSTRPSTGGTIGGGSRLPSRGNSYGQPAAATVAPTNAQGRFSQPKGKQYSISAPLSQPEPMIGDPSIGRPSTQRLPASYQQSSASDAQNGNQRGHKRSNTVSETLGRVASIFSSRTSHDQNQQKAQKSYPPTSMAVAIAADDAPRQSTESSRRTSFGFNRRNPDQSGATKPTRRFSLIPASLSKNFVGHKEKEPIPPSTSYSTTDPRRLAGAVPRSRGQTRPTVAFGRGESRSPSQSTTGSTIPVLYDGQLDRSRDSPSQRVRETRGGAPSSAPAQQTQFAGQNYLPPIGDDKFPGPNAPHPASQPYRERPYHHANDSEASEPMVPQSHRPQYPASFNSYDSPQQSRGERPGVLQKSRKFADAYDERQQGHHGGSSGSAKRVMDIFRRIAKQKEKEDLTLKHNVEPNPHISPSLLLEPTSSPLRTSWEGKSGSDPEQRQYDNPPPTLMRVPTPPPLGSGPEKSQHDNSPPTLTRIPTLPPLGSITDQIQQDAPSSSLTRPKLVSPAERTSVIVEQKLVAIVKSSFPFVQSNQVGLMGKPSLPMQQKSVIGTSKNTLCAKCGEKLSGQFVCNLGNAFHLECLTCADCGEIIASKFWSLEDGGSSMPIGLCETDYFRRHDMLCFECGGALHGNYISALDRKYHVEHFGCPNCDRAFGAYDNYYEHDGAAYCLYHYAVRWAQVCHGCETLILKKFVEDFCDGANQYWHPECYMIHKYWNVRIAGKSLSSCQIDFTKRPFSNSIGPDFNYARMQELMARVEERGAQICEACWAFEGLCATDIYSMLLHASDGDYSEVMLTTSRFIAKVDTIFWAIDAISRPVTPQVDWKGPPTLQESKLLCKKVVNLFHICVKSAETGVTRLGVTQELLLVVTDLAHYVKLLVQIGLRTSLKLEDNRVSKALTVFLKALTTAKDSKLCVSSIPLLELLSKSADNCAACNKPAEDDCYRLDKTIWHKGCYKCTHCGVVYNGRVGVLGKLTCYSCRVLSNVVSVSRLEQHSHLLHVALARFRATICPDKPLSDIFIQAEPLDLPSSPAD